MNLPEIRVPDYLINYGEYVHQNQPRIPNNVQNGLEQNNRNDAVRDFLAEILEIALNGPADLEGRQNVLQRVIEQMNQNLYQQYQRPNLNRRAQPHGVQQPAPEAPNLNGGQSTHKASVHASASESAKKLYNRYQFELQGKRPAKLMAKITNDVRNCRCDHLKKQAALKCITRLTDGAHNYTDLTSKVTNQQ